MKTPTTGKNGAFEIANPSFTLNMEAAIESVKKIKKLNSETIVCYHGGIMQKDIATKLDSLILRYS